MPAMITVKYLGDAAMEKQIRARLEKEFGLCDASWRVIVSRLQVNDWKIEVDGGNGREHSVRRLEAHQTADKIVEEAAHMVKTVQREHTIS